MQRYRVQTSDITIDFLQIFDLSSRLSKNVLSYKSYPDNYEQNKLNNFKSAKPFLEF